MREPVTGGALTFLCPAFSPEKCRPIRATPFVARGPAAMSVAAQHRQVRLERYLIHDRLLKRRSLTIS